MPRQAKTFTIFDVMDRKGYFDSNPANAQATSADGQPLYLGPVKYPMMLYHPEGLEQVSVPGTWEQTPNGTQYLGEKKEIIFQLVENEADELKLRSEGWHEHPAQAIAAAQELDPLAFKGLPAPPMAAKGQIDKLQQQIKELQAQIDKTKQPVAGDGKLKSQPQLSL